MKRRYISGMALSGMLLGLPLLGVLAAGKPVSRYLEFPPRTLYVKVAPFSWIHFVLYGLLFAALLFPILIFGGRALLRASAPVTVKRPFPWWGWMGLGLNGVSWIVAWSRIPALSFIQPHTFFPLWIAYVLVVNALCFRRDGTCMMTKHPAYFAALFPASAAFWWFFEYLNRFVQNWQYVGVEYGPAAYACLATLSFSTVLPAVLGTREWFLGTRWIREGFVFCPPALMHFKGVGAGVLILSGLGLLGIGIWPNALFPLLWVSPLLILLSFQVLTQEGAMLKALRRGDLRPAVSAALAALVCGLFWEMWNFHSLAKWVYRIPYVHRFELFEMPVLGYAGYLPFGLECAVIGDLLARGMKKSPRA